MAKIFTADDVLEVTHTAYITGIDQIWCKIIFKGGSNPVDFNADPQSTDPFTLEMYSKLKAGEYGEPIHGLARFRTQPPTQEGYEAAALEKRAQLLLESDWTDTPAAQSRLSDADKKAWADYRQALRDITSHPAYPWDPAWPVKPK